LEITSKDSCYLTRNGYWITIVGDKRKARFCRNDEPYPLLGLAFDPNKDQVCRSYSKKEARIYCFDTKGKCKTDVRYDIIGELF